MSKIRHLILHVGQTKAGSTSIQNYLDAERESLKAAGMLFPATKFERKNAFDPTRTAGSLPLIKEIHKGNVSEFEKEIEAFSGDTLILSAENLFSDQPDEVISSLGFYFKDAHIKIVVILRPQASWVVSRYQESVLSGFHCSTKRFSDFCDDQFNSGALRYYERLVRIGNLVNSSEIEVIDYERACQCESLVESFLKTSNIPITNSNFASNVRSNVRPKIPALLESKRRLNILTAGLPLKFRLEIEALLLNEFDSICLRSKMNSTVSIFCKSQVDALDVSNRMLSQKFLGGQTLGVSPNVSMFFFDGHDDDIRNIFHRSILIVLGLIESDIISNPNSELKYNAIAALTRELLNLAMESSSTSLHLNSWVTAVICGLSQNGVHPVILVEPESLATYVNGLQLDTSLSPTEIVHLTIPNLCEEAATCERTLYMLKEVYARRAQRIFIGPSIGIDATLGALSKMDWRGEIIIEDAASFFNSKALELSYISIIGRCGPGVKIGMNMADVEAIKV